MTVKNIDPFDPTMLPKNPAVNDPIKGKKIKSKYIYICIFL